MFAPAVSKSLLSASGSFGVTYWSGATDTTLLAPLVAPTMLPAPALDDNTNIVFVAGTSVSLKVMLLTLSVLVDSPTDEYDTTLPDTVLPDETVCVTVSPTTKSPEPAPSVIVT